MIQQYMLDGRFAYVGIATFPSKRKAQCIAKKEAMKRRRTSETEQEKFARTEQDRLRNQSTRAAETYDQISAQRRSDRLRKETTRASEMKSTEVQTLGVL